MENSFSYTIPKGAIIHQSGKASIKITGDLPENVQKLWENGDGLFVLNKNAGAILEGYSKEKLEKIHALRKAHGYETELSLIEKALKKAKSDTKAKSEPA